MRQSEVFNIDCMVGMKDYPDKYFDLAVVDPPYGINVAKMAYTQEENRPCKQKNGGTLVVKKLAYKHGDWDNNIPTEEYFIEMKRISKEQVIWGWNYYGLEWGDGLIKWNKLVPDGVSFSKYEYAFCSLIDCEIEFEYLWTGFSQAVSLSQPKTQRGNKKLNEKRIHPTHKPIDLYSWIYKNYLHNGGKVIDTHLGSGSNRIAADKAGNIDFVGFELDKDYYEAQEKRWKNYKAQLNLFA